MSPIPPTPAAGMTVNLQDYAANGARMISLWDFYQILQQILMGQAALEKKMADLSTEINNLVTVVTSISTDVQAVLAKLAAAPNITADQVATLEAQIAALQQVDQSLQAAVNPS